MMASLLTIVALAGAYGLGLAVAEWLLPDCPRESALSAKAAAARQWQLRGLAIVLGTGLTAWLLFVWSLLGGTWGRGPSGTLLGLGLLAGGWAVRCGRARQLKLLSPEIAATEDNRRRAHAHARKEIDPERAFVVGCQSIIIGLVVLAFVQTLMLPQRFWDERATFGLRAATIAWDGGVWSKDLRHPDYVLYHPRYPLLVPMLEAHLYALFGTVDDRWAKAWFPWLYAGMLLTFLGILLERHPPGVAWLWTVVLATVPVLMPNELGFLSGQADAPLGCFHGVSLCYLALACTREEAAQRQSSIIAGLAAGFAAFTKDEGLAFFLVDGALIAAIGLHGLVTSNSRRPAAASASAPDLVVSSTPLPPQMPAKERTAAISGLTWLAYIVPILVLTMPWWWYRRLLPMTTEMDYFGRLTYDQLASRAATIPWMLRHLASRLFWEVREWGWQWWLMVLLAVLVPRRIGRRDQLLLLLSMLGALLALVVAGLLAPTAVEEHIGGASQRFLMQLAPVAILFAARQIPSDSEDL